MYTVRVEARLNILGEVVKRFNVEVNEYSTKHEAMQIAEQIAWTNRDDHSECFNGHVHFIATRCSAWQ